MGTGILFLTNLSIGNLAALYGRLSPSIPLVLMLIIMLLCKAFCNIGTPNYYALLSAGFSGMIASSMNIPIAAGIRPSMTMHSPKRRWKPF